MVSSYVKPRSSARDACSQARLRVLLSNFAIAPPKPILLAVSWPDFANMNESVKRSEYISLSLASPIARRKEPNNCYPGRPDQAWRDSRRQSANNWHLDWHSS